MHGEKLSTTREGPEEAARIGPAGERRRTFPWLHRSQHKHRPGPCRRPHQGWRATTKDSAGCLTPLVHGFILFPIRRDKFPRERPSLLGDPRRPLSPPTHWRPPPSRPLPRAFPFPPPSLPREVGPLTPLLLPQCPPSLLGSPPTKRARGPEREMTRAQVGAPTPPHSCCQLNKPERKIPKTGGSDGFQPVIMTFKVTLMTCQYTIL